MRLLPITKCQSRQIERLFRPMWRRYENKLSKPDFPHQRFPPSQSCLLPTCRKASSISPPLGKAPRLANRSRCINTSTCTYKCHADVLVAYVTCNVMQRQPPTTATTTTSLPTPFTHHPWGRGISRRNKWSGGRRLALEKRLNPQRECIVPISPVGLV